MPSSNGKIACNGVWSRVKVKCSFFSVVSLLSSSVVWDTGTNGGAPSLLPKASRLTKEEPVSVKPKSYKTMSDQVPPRDSQMECTGSRGLWSVALKTA